MNRSQFVGALAAGAVLSPLAISAPAGASIDEAEIGREAYDELNQSGAIIFDSSYYDHLNEVGQIISVTVRNRYPYPIRFYIVKGDSPNAFSIPGGNIYVNEPLLSMAKNRDELGGVLAHETGHMVLHHVAKEIANDNRIGTIANIGSILAQIFLGPLASLPADYALGTVQDLQGANLSRHIEAQADEEGARIMAATGVLNPWGMVWFFKMMLARFGDSGSLYMRDHPFDRDRIADLEHLFASDPATFGKFKNTHAGNEVYW